MYGSTYSESQNLRNFTNNIGELKIGISMPSGKPLMPFSAGHPVDCQRDVRESAIDCFLAGDVRANEQVWYNKAFRHVETLFVQGRNLYLAGLLLVTQDLFTFRQPIADLQGSDIYLGRIKFLHVERPYLTVLKVLQSDWSGTSFTTIDFSGVSIYDGHIEITELSIPPLWYNIVTHL